MRSNRWKGEKNTKARRGQKQRQKVTATPGRIEQGLSPTGVPEMRTKKKDSIHSLRDIGKGGKREKDGKTQSMYARRNGREPECNNRFGWWPCLTHRHHNWNGARRGLGETSPTLEANGKRGDQTLYGGKLIGGAKKVDGDPFNRRRISLPRDNTSTEANAGEEKGI